MCRGRMGQVRAAARHRGSPVARRGARRPGRTPCPTRWRARQAPRERARHPVGPTGLMSCADPACGEALERSPEVAFGVDQEIGRHNDLLPGLESFANLDKAVAPEAQLHGPRLEQALAALDDHHLPVAAVDDRGDGHAQPLRLAGRGVDLHVGVHLVYRSIVFEPRCIGRITAGPRFESGDYCVLASEPAWPLSATGDIRRGRFGHLLSLKRRARPVRGPACIDA